MEIYVATDMATAANIMCKHKLYQYVTSLELANKICYTCYAKNFCKTNLRLADFTIAACTEISTLHNCST